jgi:hypothetical protein
MATAGVICLVLGYGRPITTVIQARRADDTVIPLEVGIYTSVGLDEAKVKAIADNIGKILQDVDSGGDQACPVDLDVRSVFTFSTGDGTIDSKLEFDALFDEHATNGIDLDELRTAGGPKVRQVRIVDGIYWCSGRMGSDAGCADQLGLHVAASSREGLDSEIWAHEVGHTRGLFHRDDELAVMNPQIVSSAHALNWLECAVYKR